MGDTNTVPGDLRVGGTIFCGGMSLPTNVVIDANVSPVAKIQASKLQHQHAVRHTQVAGADIASKTEDIYIVRGVSGTVVGVQVAASTAPTGGNKLFSVDLLKGSQASAFATLLTGVITYDNTKTNREVASGTLVGSPTVAAGDTLRIVVAASGSTGSQGQGLVVTVQVREDAD
jgi:hypothetical protein